MVAQKCWFFGPPSHRSAKYYFLPLPNFDTLIPKVSVPIVIFRTKMLILNITHHIPFVHHFPPFTIHIGYIILPYGFRFQSCMKIHDIIQAIYECLNDIVNFHAPLKTKTIRKNNVPYMRPSNGCHTWPKKDDKVKKSERMTIPSGIDWHS